MPENLDKLIDGVLVAVNSDTREYRDELRAATASALSRSWRAGYSAGHTLRRYHEKRLARAPSR